MNIKIQKVLPAVALGLILSAPVMADNDAKGPQLLPIAGKPFGQSYKDWAIDFSQWFYSIPYNINPIVGQIEGISCTQPQHGKVWFIGSGADEVKTGLTPEKCTIPYGKAVFVHLGFYVDTYPCPDPTFKPAPGQSLVDFLTSDATAIVDGAITHKLTPNTLKIDGKFVVGPEKIFDQRIDTGLFTLTGDLSLQSKWDSCVTGKPQNALTDGFFALIDGLTPGVHKFEFSNYFSETVNTTMFVTVDRKKTKDD